MLEFRLHHHLEYKIRVSKTISKRNTSREKIGKERTAFPFASFLIVSRPIRIPEYGKFWLEKSVVLGFGILNSVQEICNPESKFHSQGLRNPVLTLNPG